MKEYWNVEYNKKDMHKIADKITELHKRSRNEIQADTERRKC